MYPLSLKKYELNPFVVPRHTFRKHKTTSAVNQIHWNKMEKTQLILSRILSNKINTKKACWYVGKIIVTWDIKSGNLRQLFICSNILNENHARPPDLSYKTQYMYNVLPFVSHYFQKIPHSSTCLFIAKQPWNFKPKSDDSRKTRELKPSEMEGMKFFRNWFMKFIQEIILNWIIN